MNLKSLLLYLFCLTSLFSGEFVFDDKDDFKQLKKKGIRLTKSSAKNYKLELSPKKIESNIEFLLDFENKKAAELKDSTGHYMILNSNYSVGEQKSLLGKRYASFAASNSFISVSANNGRLLSSTHFTEPFYISFFVMPGESEQYSVVFSKTLITGGKKFGIESNIVNNKMEVKFHNMFSYSKSESKSFFLKSPDKLKTEEWTHVLISIDPMSGKALLFEDGKIKSEVEAVISSDNPTALPFGFHTNDTTPLLIGKGFFGKLDQFMIGIGEPDMQSLTEPYRGVEYDDIIKFASQFKGVAYSPVLQTKNSFSKLQKLDYDISQPAGTHFEIHFRTSNSFFTEDNTEIPWMDSSEFKEDSQIYFKYLQWKLVLRADFAGKLTPSLYKLQFRYLESVPPNAPTGLRITKMEGDSLGVCLNWVSNFEANVREGGRYLIHYGVSPERMVGILTVDSNSKPFTGLAENKDLTSNYKSLTQCINNDLITHNALNRIDKNLLFFKPGITYYFKITACNSNYNEINGMDQKSKPSNPISFTFKNQPNY